MKKKDFIQRMSEKYRISKKASRDIVEKYNGMIEECLSTGEEFGFPNIYQMGVKLVAERDYVHPVTKEKITSPAHKVPYCKFGKSIRTAVGELKV